MIHYVFHHLFFYFCVPLWDKAYLGNEMLFHNKRQHLGAKRRGKNMHGVIFALFRVASIPNTYMIRQMIEQNLTEGRKEGTLFKCLIIQR